MPSSLYFGGVILNPRLQHSVYRLEPVEALFVRDGKIAAVGRLSDLEALVTPQTRRVNLEGRMAGPRRPLADTSRAA